MAQEMGDNLWIIQYKHKQLKCWCKFAAHDTENEAKLHLSNLRDHLDDKFRIAKYKRVK